MKKHILILILFFLITTLITFPLIFHLKNYAFEKGDQLLITWVLNWNIHALLTNPLKIFEANIFYPYHNTLSFSETFFTSSLIALIPTLLLKEPLVAYNINVLVSLTLLGFFTYLLTKYLTKNDFAAIISGLLIVFSPFTIGRLFQLQVVSIQWIPLSLLFFLQFLKNGKYKNLVFTCLFFLLQIGNSFQPGYFLILCYVIILIYYFFHKQSVLKKFLTKKALLIVILTGIITCLLGYPYFKTSKTFNYVRDIRDTIHFANRPEYFFYPNDKTRLKDIILNTIYKNDKGPYKYDGYWGLPLLVLTGIALINRLIGVKKKQNHRLFDIFFLIAVASFILSLGPAWQWGGKVIKHPFIIPLPYAIFYYLIPGFKGIRNSARWEMLSVFSVSIFIGLILAPLLKNKRWLTSLVITIIIALSILLEINLPLKYVQVPTIKEFPKTDYFIASLPKNSVIIHLPIYTWYILPYSDTEFMREYFSILHFKKMVNGFSGFFPAEWEKNAITLTTQFPDKKTTDYLKQIKINYIIVHKKEYDRLHDDKFKINGQLVSSFDSLAVKISQSSVLEFIAKFGDDYVYRMN